MHLLLNIDVPDLASAQSFYCAAFGLAPARRLGSEVLELAGGSVAIYLLQKPAGSRPAQQAASARSYARHWCPLHFDVVVADIEAAVARCLAAGAVQERAIEAANWGRIAQFADPFGHGFCLIEFTGRGYDEIAS